MARFSRLGSPGPQIPDQPQHPARRPPSTGAAPPSSKRRRSAQPVSTLTPYNDTWTIKARVAKKEPLRSYEKDGTSKSVFSMELVDDQVLDNPLLPGQAASIVRAGMLYRVRARMAPSLECSETTAGEPQSLHESLLALCVTGDADRGDAVGRDRGPVPRPAGGVQGERPLHGLSQSEVCSLQAEQIRTTVEPDSIAAGT